MRCFFFVSCKGVACYYLEMNKYKNVVFKVKYIKIDTSFQNNVTFEIQVFFFFYEI